MRMAPDPNIWFQATENPESVDLIDLAGGALQTTLGQLGLDSEARLSDVQVTWDTGAPWRIGRRSAAPDVLGAMYRANRNLARALNRAIDESRHASSPSALMRFVAYHDDILCRFTGRHPDDILERIQRLWLRWQGEELMQRAFRPPGSWAAFDGRICVRW
jgi:hypothetical protein